MSAATRVRFAALALGLAALGAAACAPPRVTSVRDPAGARRFEIIDVGDSSFRFLAAGTRWVRDGDVGVAVDPRRRDALVAQFVVQRRVADTATALITGQTARVATQHVALLDPPSYRTLRQRPFWWGVLAGVVAGVGVGLATTR